MHAAPRLETPRRRSSLFVTAPPADRSLTQPFFASTRTSACSPSRAGAPARPSRPTVTARSDPSRRVRHEGASRSSAMPAGPAPRRGPSQVAARRGPAFADRRVRLQRSRSARPPGRRRPRHGRSDGLRRPRRQAGRAGRPDRRHPGGEPRRPDRQGDLRSPAATRAGLRRRPEAGPIRLQRSASLRRHCSVAVSTSSSFSGPSS